MRVKCEKEKISRVREWDPYDVFTVGLIGGLHGLCLFAPFTFSFGVWRLAIMLAFVCEAFGITMCFHRNLTHKSFTLPKYLEYFFAYIGCHAFQGDPIWWVSNHRFHHKHVDTNRDLHSPNAGFWFSYMFWLFNHKYMYKKGANFGYASDLLEKRYYRFLHITYPLHLCLQAVVLYRFGGFPFVVWGMGVRGVWGYHVAWLVNSVCHTWGRKAWNSGDLSRNNWFVAMLTYGEGWHNNHHAFEYSARHGLEWWEIDITWYIIMLLEYFGLATDVKLPSESQKKKMSVKILTENLKLNLDN